MTKKIFYVAILLFVISFTSCSKNENPKKLDEKINIVTTIFPIYDFTRAITKDKAGLSLLIKPGVEIHSFAPTPDDILKIENSDIFIYIGGESDKWVENILKSINTNDKKIVRLIDYILPLNEELVPGMQEDTHIEEDDHKEAHDHKEDHIEEHNKNEDHYHDGDYDEHIWTSPNNAILMINELASVISSIDIENRYFYEENAKVYSKDIEDIDEEIKKIVASSRRKNIVFGDRFPFRYFANDYGLEYRAPFLGCSSETQASAKTIAYLINYIKDNGIPYVFYIEMSNEKIANIIAEQTKSDILQLHSCQNVTKEEFDSGVTYVSLMKNNVESIRKGLN